MTKSELIAELKRKEGLTKKTATEIVNGIFDGFIDSLRKGDRIEIRGFGTLSVRNHDGYIGRNPKTGDKTEVNSKRLPFFKVGKELKDYVNEITPPKVDMLLHYCNSYTRLPTLIDAYRNEIISEREFFFGLRDVWSSCDNISEYYDDLNYILEESTIYWMMNYEERNYYEDLPDTVTIYRGCDEQTQYGLCWSLDRDTAIEFPFLNRYKAKNPMLVTATVYKDEIVAVKLDRDECEVITFSPEVIMVTPLTEADRNPKIEKEKHLGLMKSLQ